MEAGPGRQGRTDIYTCEAQAQSDTFLILTTEPQPHTIPGGVRNKSAFRRTALTGASPGVRTLRRKESGVPINALGGWAKYRHIRPTGTTATGDSDPPRSQHELSSRIIGS